MRMVFWGLIIKYGVSDEAVLHLQVEGEGLVLDSKGEMLFLL